MLESSAVLYIFGTIYAAGLLLPFLAPERAQFTAVSSVYRPLTLSLIIAHCIAAYLSDLHFVLEVFASTAILLVPLSIREELRDEPKKIFGSKPFSKMLWYGLIILCLVFFGRVLFGSSQEYGYLVSSLNILVQLFLALEILNSFRATKSIHLMHAMIAALVPLPMVALRIISISAQDEYSFSLVNESELSFMLRLAIGASFFIVLSAVSNFKFQTLWNKERKLRVDAERHSLDSLIALSIAQDNEAGNRDIRKRKYVQALVDNLKQKGWFIMPDPDADMDQLLSDRRSSYHTPNADSPSNVLEGVGQQGSLLGDDIPQTVRLMAVADMYDVRTSKRSWKRSWTHNQAVAEITDMAGSRLDPTVVTAFLEVETTFSAIAHAWTDDP